MINRRNFLGWLSAFPIVGRIFQREMIAAAPLSPNADLVRYLRNLADSIEKNPETPMQIEWRLRHADVTNEYGMVVDKMHIGQAILIQPQGLGFKIIDTTKWSLHGDPRAHVERAVAMLSERGFSVQI